MIQSLKNIWNIPELRRRVMYTLGLLAVYRIGGHIPTGCGLRDSYPG